MASINNYLFYFFQNLQTTATGEVQTQGVTIAQVSDQRLFPNRAKAEESFWTLKESTEQLQRMVEFLKLLPYLTGDCSVCRRVEPGS